jgi:hypothetical protein
LPTSTYDHIPLKLRTAPVFVSCSAYLEGEEIDQQFQPQFLLELLELIFKQFRIVARVHDIVLANMKRVKNTSADLGDFCLYDTVEVWVKVQSVVCKRLKASPDDILSFCAFYFSWNFSLVTILT